MRLTRLLLPAIGAVLALVPASGLADSGASSPTLSFFSGGGGAQAHWNATSDQPSGDIDNQDIEIDTTTAGYAGVLVHHVTGIPVAEFPDSSYWMKGPVGPTLGSPRLEVIFETAAGAPDGDAQLVANTFTGDWQFVSDTYLLLVQNGWDLRGGTCGFQYHVTWQIAQGCHAGDLVSSVYFIADPYPRTQYLDDISVDGKFFTSASDNGGGVNDPAGPDATLDTSLVPTVVLPPI